MVQIGKKRLVVRSHLDLLCWSLQSSKDGDCTTSLGNLLLSMNIPVPINVLLTPNSSAYAQNVVTATMTGCQRILFELHVLGLSCFGLKTVVHENLI